MMNKMPPKEKSRSGSFSGANALLAANAASASRIAKDRGGRRGKDDALSQSTPASAFSPSSGYPKALMYRTLRGSAMRVATLDESIHTTYGSGREDLSMSLPVASMRSAAVKATKGLDDGVAEIPKNRSVEFGNLEIREYARTCGDNPSCSAGPPIGLSWEYDPDILEVNVDEYEETRPPRRSYGEMAMPRSVRNHMLSTEWGITRAEIARAVRESNRIKNSRRRTVNNLDTGFSKMEEVIESAKKGLKRKVTRKKKVSEQYEEWKREIELQWELWAAEAAIEEENRAAAAAATATDAETNDGGRRGKRDKDNSNDNGASGDTDGPVLINEDQAVAWVSGASSHGRDVVLGEPGGSGGGKKAGSPKEQSLPQERGDDTRSLSMSEQSSGSVTYEVVP